jgi:AraC-like DNA-binding protein
MTTDEHSTGAYWQARWYLWDGGFLALGRRTTVVPPHSHHAIQITMALEGDVGMRSGTDDWTTYQGVITAPDVAHQLDPRGALFTLIFVDPECTEGRWLRRALRGPLTAVSQPKLDLALPALRAFWEEPVDAPQTARMIHSVVRGLCAGPPPSRPLDKRMVRALEVIRQMDTRKISIEDVAGAVFLSPSRFAHLFKEEIGLPFRRYVLWRRLTRAMIAVGQGKTLTAAAHACGFSDSAHLTRSSTQMFGLPPSVMLDRSEFYEVPAPFELPTE